MRLPVLIAFVWFVFITSSCIKGLCQEYEPVPEWVKRAGTSNKFNDVNYYTGYASISLNQEPLVNYDNVISKKLTLREAKEQARKIAVENLSTSIQVSIEVISKKEETQTISGSSEQLSSEYEELFTSKSTQKSSIELHGLKHHDYHIKGDNVVHSFAYVSKQELIDYYKKTIEDYNADLKLYFDEGIKVISLYNKYPDSINYRESARKNFNKCQGVLLKKKGIKNLTRKLGIENGLKHYSLELEREMEKLSLAPISNTEDLALRISE